MELDESKKILFYDGDCGFCNSSVQFVLKHKKNNIYFVTLQSKLAEKSMSKNDITIKMDTLYFLNNNRIYSKSSAALQISKQLKFPYPLFLAFYIVPPFIRDGLYSFIAKRRHKIKNGFCLLPEAHDKKLFLTDHSQL